MHFRHLMIFLSVFISAHNHAQTDSIQSGVVFWNTLKEQKTNTGSSRQILNGRTLDLANLRIHASTLMPGMQNHPPLSYNDVEELVIVKDGNLKVTINDSSVILGPGGSALIVAGDRQSFQNSGDKPSTYYVLRFTARNPVNIAQAHQAGGSFVKDWTALTVRTTDKGESRPIFVRPTSMFKRFDLHATALNPGFASHLPHTHRAEEIILVTKGSVQMQIGEKFYPVTEGDLIFLASNMQHAAKNTGNEQCGYFAIQWNN